MSNKTYDKLKWIAIVFLPAFITFLGIVLTTLNVNCTETVLIIASAFATFLGTILGVSNSKYSKKKGGK